MITEKQVRLGHFPVGYPNELWYGVESRFAKRQNIKGYTYLTRTLYGRDTSKHALTLPYELKTLINRLPLGHNLTVMEILMKHTLFPYMMRFLPKEHGERIIAKMKNEIENDVLPMTKLNLPEFLRLCTTCVEEQKEIFGESYWDRRWELPYVKYCTKHGSPLAITKIPVGPGTQVPITVDEVLKQGLIEPPIKQIGDSEKWEKIAFDSVWLLETSEEWFEKELIIGNYQSFLSNTDYASYSLTVHGKKLQSDFRAAYGEEFLREFSLYYELNTAPWIATLIRDTLKHLYRIPIQHILLLHFLGKSIKDLFSKPRSFFCEGPWPCLNPVCPQYHVNVIQEMKIEFSRNVIPIGIFSCTCGYIYRRFGPDQSSDDAKKGKVIDEGQLWRETFIQDWNNELITMDELKRKYKLSRKKLIKKVEQLKLKNPRNDPLNPTLRWEIFQHYGNTKDLHSDNIKNICRQIWIDASTGQSEIQAEKLNAIHQWLQDNDANWLSTHTQPRARQLKSFNDASLAKEIQEIALSIRNLMRGNKIRKVTLQAIASRLGDKSLQIKDFEAFPNSLKVLQEVLETPQSYAMRKLRVKAQWFYENKIYPSTNMLIVAAAISDLPQDTVEKLLQETYEYLDMLYSSENK